MNQQQFVTGAIVTASLVVAFLLGQPDVVLPPLVKVALGATNVALVYWARVSNGSTPMTTVTTPSGVSVTATDPAITVTTDTIVPPRPRQRLGAPQRSSPSLLGSSGSAWS